MKDFISLREFLLLTDPVDLEPKRSIFHSELLSDDHYWYAKPRVIANGYGLDFVKRYDIAKASWEKYGDAGPPVGSTVETLRSGHGGGPGCHRRFEGIYASDPRFFAISRKPIQAYYDEPDQISLVEKTQWWAHIRVSKDPNE